MKNRDLFLPSLTTLIIFGLSWFLNCAHQNRVREGIDTGVEQSDDSDLSSLEGEANEESSETATAEQTPNEEKSTELKDTDLAELTQEGVAPENTETSSGATTSSLDAEADLAKLENEAGTGAAAESTGTLMAEPEMPDSLAVPESTPPPVEEQVAEAPKEEPVIVPPTIEETKVEKPVKVARAYRSSKVPRIPETAISRNGTELNRFYFVRQGDSAQKVSHLIYGDESHTASLRKWNKGWLPGDVVYYASPNQPGDTQMKSFYQENGITPEEYTVRRGDWLSRIAQRQLGNAGSWREIAVVNGLKSADSLVVGHRLAIYPKDLQQFVHEPEVVENTPMQPQVEPVEPRVVEVVPPQPEAQVIPPMPEPEVISPQPETIAPQVETPAPKADKGQDLDVGKFIEQNIVAAVIIGGALLLLMALASRRKRRARAESEDYSDDVGEPKAKRK